MLWIFFALAEMPLVVEMVAAYPHPRRTSYTFWAMYMLVQGPFTLTCPTCMCQVCINLVQFPYFMTLVDCAEHFLVFTNIAQKVHRYYNSSVLGLASLLAVSQMLGTTPISMKPIYFFGISNRSPKGLVNASALGSAHSCCTCVEES